MSECFEKKYDCKRLILKFVIRKKNHESRKKMLKEMKNNKKIKILRYSSNILKKIAVQI